MRPLPATERRTAVPRRYRLGALCFTGYLIGYMDRANLSVTAPVMMTDFGWSPSLMGAILSAFYLGFALAHLPGGWLADRFGPKPVLLAGGSIWSLATALTPLVPSPRALYALRFGLGLGEGVNSPATGVLLARWFPAAELTRAVSAVTTGIFAGIMLATPLATAIMVWWGWPAVFWIFSGLGAVWLVLFARGVADRPEDDDRLDPAERALILAERVYRDGPRTAVPWAAIARTRAVWALGATVFANNFGMIMLSVWVPTYLVKGLGFSLGAMGVLGTLPYLAMMLGMNLGGWASDAAIARGWPKVWVRKTSVLAGYAFALVALVGLSRPQSPAVAVVLLACAQGAFAFGQASFVVNPLDLSPRFAGTLQGVTVTLADLAGTLAPVTAGWIIESSLGWSGVFLAVAACVVAAGIVWGLFAEAEPQI